MPIRGRLALRRDTDFTVRMTKSIFGDVPLTDAERRFLQAAHTGNHGDLLQVLEENNRLNLNCVDYLGRSALHLAVLEEHHEIIVYLLDRCKLEVVEDALMIAIKHSNLKICEFILNHRVYSNEKYRLKLQFQHEFYDQDESNPFFSSDLTPIVLAAHYNNCDIVNLLLQKGFKIHAPHDFFCTCTECRNHKEVDSVVHSRSRLNAFRGLASTAYISMSSDDPILTAFKLSKQLRHLGEREKQYKYEYHQLEEQCNHYAVELFSLCRTQEEVMAALHGDAHVSDLQRIKLAMKYQQKKFIAHASCQEHLQNTWYGETPWVRHTGMVGKALLLPLAVLLMPVLSVVYILFPHSKAGRIIRTPFFKFVNYAISYLVFLMLLFIDTNRATEGRNGEKPFDGPFSAVNILILFYVVGMFWTECKQMREEGIGDYLRDTWNIMDITMITLYSTSYTIQFVVAYNQRPLQDEVTPLVVSNMMASVADVLSFTRIVSLLPASETFGQLQISYGRMLADVAKFMVIYATVMLAFVCGLTNLYSIHTASNDNFNTIGNSVASLFWSTFGMGDREAPLLKEGGPAALTMYTGYIMYGCYLLGAVVVLINMLIAMMSQSFQEIKDEEDVEWKFARAKLWIYYIQQGSTLPIPFNIIPTPKSLWRYLVKLKEFVLDLLALMHKVVLRYIHRSKFGRNREDWMSKDGDLGEAKDDIVGQVKKLYQGINTRLTLVTEDVRTVQAEVMYIEQRLNRFIFNKNQGRGVPNGPTNTIVGHVSVQDDYTDKGCTLGQREFGDEGKGKGYEAIVRDPVKSSAAVTKSSCGATKSPDPSPMHKPVPSPVRKSGTVRNPSPLRTPHPSPSPVRNPAPSPLRNPSPSPIRNPSPSAQRNPSSSQIRNPSPSQLRNPSPSAQRNPSANPLKNPNPSPLRNQSPSQIRNPSPSAQTNPSPSGLRNPSPSPTSFRYRRFSNGSNASNSSSRRLVAIDNPAYVNSNNISDSSKRSSRHAKGSSTSKGNNGKSKSSPGVAHTIHRPSRQNHDWGNKT